MSDLYLVTGGAGFIGSAIVRKLVVQGERVRVFDNLSTGKRENLLPVIDEVELIEGDLRDDKAVSRAVDGVCTIFHHAALASVPGSVDDPVSTNQVNVTGTVNLLEASRKSGINRLVFASSSSVYGESLFLPQDEEMTLRPDSPYAASKVAGEYYCRVFTEVYGLPTVSLRYFNVFGPNQDIDSGYAAVIPKFIDALLRRVKPKINGDGLQTRDFVYIDDVVAANLLASSEANAVGRVMNIATAEKRSLFDLLDGLSEILEVEVEPEFEARVPGDVRDSVASISLANEILGYEPSVFFVDGLRRTVESAISSQ